MEELEKQVMDQLQHLIIIDLNGKKYVFEESIENLNIPENEKKIIKRIFLLNNIELRSFPKNECITKEQRSSRVKDFDYGEIESHGLEELDKPNMAKVEYSDNQVVLEDYTKLDEFILSDFIKNKVVTKTRKSTNRKQEITEETYKSIKLCDITALKLSEKEFFHVCKLINEQGIRICGKSESLEGVIDMYDYYCTNHNIDKYNPVTKDELNEKILKYYNDGDRLINTELEKEIILNCFKLIKYSAYKVGKKVGIDEDELMSYGYEGILYAIRSFDPAKGPSFIYWAYICITSRIKKSISQEKNIPYSIYFQFNSIKRLVEKEWGKKYDGDREMLKEIYSIAKENGLLSDNKQIFAFGEFINNKSIEEMLENDEDFIEDSVDIERIVNLSISREIINEILISSNISKTISLDDRRAKIIELKFGLNGNKEHTLEQIAIIYNTTRENIGRLEMDSLRKIRRNRRIKDIKQLCS